MNMQTCPSQPKSASAERSSQQITSNSFAAAFKDYAAKQATQSNITRCQTFVIPAALLAPRGPSR